MTITLKFYADAALTTELNSSNPLSFAFAADGSTGSVDKTVYLGSTATGKTFQDSTSPGTAQIAVSIADALPAAGQAATSIKLATSSGGLATATAGASLNVGTSISSGVGNAVPIYIRATPSSLTTGTYLDLSLTTQSLQEA